MVEQAFIGFCANGTLDDLAIVAQVLAGQWVAKGNCLVVTLPTQDIYRVVMVQRYVQIIMLAAGVLTNATRGTYGGGSLGLVAPGEDCITASARIF